MSYSKKYHIDIKANKEVLTTIINDVSTLKNPDHKKVEKIIHKNPAKNGNILSKSAIYLAYLKLKDSKDIKLTQNQEKQFLKHIQMKKIRTLSGVVPVTVLTKPFFCPGECIFCPTDIKMPKSYISNEPGAQRALSNDFDPYLQTFNRLLALRNMGHPTEKVELIILGGTWSVYPEKYQIWFIKRCFEALNDFGNSKTTKMLKKGFGSEEKVTWKELFKVHKQNETAKSRCVGLSVETRPDYVTQEEVIRMRKLGATKVQIGIQGLDSKILKINKRGHSVETTKEAIKLLRLGGFKIHVHWMPNLYGSDLKKDKLDFKKLFSDPAIIPDELKIYPCMLMKGTELENLYDSGDWEPHTNEQLENLLVYVFKNVPRFCRITRVIRDFSGDDILAGSKQSNLRQVVEKKVKSKDVRAREVRDEKFENAKLKITKYDTSVSEEQFLEFVTPDDKIVGFLRLSLPEGDLAMIREVHVYGKSEKLGEEGRTQHIGYGTKLIDEAKEISRKRGYRGLRVISAVGTRKYYEKLEFMNDGLYQCFHFIPHPELGF
ncbi:elongator complex protein 3 [Patescibacteria group bacterium]